MRTGEAPNGRGQPLWGWGQRPSDVLLNIRHRTVYRYTRAVRLGPHRIMTCPRGRYDLKLIKTLLSTDPPASIDWTQDVFGNLIATASFAGSTEKLAIDSRAVVEQSATNWPVFSIAPAAHFYPFSYPADDSLDLAALLVPEQNNNQQVVREWARSFVGSQRSDTLSLIKTVNEGVHREIEYRWRDQEGTQTAAETLGVLSGSCRDMATLFAEAMRHLGIAARIASGYLFDANASNQRGATHAWGEVYLPCAGWIAFDPTNARMGNANLIPVATGRKISQVMPVTGSYAGTPEDLWQMGVEVNVTPAIATSQNGSC